MERSNALERYGFELPKEATAIEADSGLVVDSNCGGRSLWVLCQILAFPTMQHESQYSLTNSNLAFPFSFTERTFAVSKPDAVSLSIRNA